MMDDRIKTVQMKRSSIQDIFVTIRIADIHRNMQYEKDMHEKKKYEKEHDRNELIQIFCIR